MSEQNFFINTLSPKGRGLDVDGRVEVIGALPDEEVRAQLGAKKKKLRLAYLREVVSASEDRVQPRCRHAPECGGCSLQQLDYFAQLAEKEKRIASYFESLIQKFSPEMRPIIGCENPWHYRNKMEFSFSENQGGEKFLGLILAGSRGWVFNLSECFLVSDWFSDTLNQIRHWWNNSTLSAYNHHNDTGHLRSVTLRESKQGTGKMVMLTVSGNSDYSLRKKDLTQFVEALKGEKDLSIFLQVHQIQKGKPTQFFEMLLEGPDHITEKLHLTLLGKEKTLSFKISPTSFFQPNTKQAEILYSEALDMIPNLQGSRVLDLYCGGATIGLSAAVVAKEVIGIELNPHSVFDAGWNQEVNEIENFQIHRGDVGSVLAEKKLDPPDLVIVDPPRAGLDQQALKEVISLSPRHILYISCNPKTQSENAEVFTQQGYQLKVLQPIDQFPHTIHIENIALFEKP